ncbi:MAG: 2-oxoglutarate ferredoxin oxidoreductase subunit alpha, partial [Bacteroidota bacterium]
TGGVSYDPANHQHMVKTRAAKVQRVRNEIPPCHIDGDGDGTLIVGWGSTRGAIEVGVERARAAGHRVGHLHLRWIWPLPADLGDLLNRYDRVLVPELNNGQLVRLLREQYLVDAQPVTKVQGLPFKAAEIEGAIVSGP